MSEHICRTCLQEIKNSNIHILNSNADLKKQLEFCVPEMVLDLVVDPVVCTPCVTALHSAYNFRNQCLRVEEQIKKYMQIIKLDANSVALIDVKSANVELPLTAKKEAALGLNVADDLNNLLDQALQTVVNQHTFENENYVSPKQVGTITKEENEIKIEVLNDSSNDMEFDHKEKNETPKLDDCVAVKDCQVKCAKLSDDTINLQTENLQVNSIDKPFICYECNFSTNLKQNLINHILICHQNKTLCTCDTCSYSTPHKGRLTIHVKNCVATEEKNFNCNMCSFSCINKDLFKNHMRDAHDSNKVHICKICNNNYTSPEYLVEHMRLHSGEKSFKCNECDYCTSRKHILKIHMLKHKTGNSYKCKKCKFSTYYSALLKAHVQKVHGQKVYVCNICNYKTSTIPGLMLHKRIHDNPEKPFICDTCGYKSLYKACIIKHVAMHNGEKFSCNKCDFRTAHKNYLSRHMRIHNGEKPCACDFRAAHKQRLTKHVVKHRNERPFTCKICYYGSSNKFDLKKHMRTHTGEKPYKCTECDYECASSTNLKNHMTIHGNKTYTCDKCDYSCFREEYLKVHMIKHTNEELPYACNTRDYRTLQKHVDIPREDKPFACNQCEFRTKNKYYLRIHMMAHTKVKPFACKQCEFRTKNKYYLRIHMMAHTKVKSFVCDKCDFSTGDRRKLLNHITIHDGVQHFRCNECDYTSQYKQYLALHMRVHQKKRSVSGTSNNKKKNKNFKQVILKTYSS